MKPTLMLLASLLAASALDAQAGSTAIDNATNAKIARLKAQKAPVDARKDRDATDAAQAAQRLGNGCQIALGNIFEDRRAGGGRRETNVIVTGDVIQANNKCK